LDNKGLHCIADIYLGSAISDDDLIFLCEKAIELTGLNVVSSMHKKFKPSGVTSVWILEESHFTLHTYPEHKYLSVDCYTCGSEGNPDAAINMLVDSLHTTKTIRNRFKRG